MTNKILDFFSRRKGSVEHAPQPAPASRIVVAGLASPTRCHCGEPTIVSDILARNFELGDFLFGYCEGCWDRMRSTHTASKLIFREGNRDVA